MAGKRGRLAAVARAARIGSIALITAGLVVLADVGLTLAWKEPVSSLYGELQQRAAADELEELEASYPASGDVQATAHVQGARRKARILAKRFRRRFDDGDAIGRIVAPTMGDLDAVVLEGTATSTLQKGPGRYPATGLPGEGRTTAIAGHRTTYLAPFRDIDSVDRGDEIRLEMPYAAFVYEVERTRIVDPSQVQIVRDVGYDRIVLTACHPLYSAAERYAVFARLRRIADLQIGSAGPGSA